MLVLGESGFHFSVDSNPLWFLSTFTKLIVIGLEKLCANFQSEVRRQLMLTSALNRFSRFSHRLLHSPSSFAWFTLRSAFSVYRHLFENLSNQALSTHLSASPLCDLLFNN